MQSTMTLTQIGLFSLAAYPYSFKLFWSPVIDSLFIPRMGRRKSWIVPLQLASGALMVGGGRCAGGGRGVGGPSEGVWA
jgi:PAT family acetyl-CoA transporter-like MFS transporter 1